MLRLSRTLDRASNVDLGDVLGVKRALARLRYYDPPTGELHGYPDAELFQGVEAFQRDRDLDVDGVMKPGGPTEASLNEALDFPLEPASAVPWRREPHRHGDGSEGCRRISPRPFEPRRKHASRIAVAAPASETFVGRCDSDEVAGGARGAFTDSAADPTRET